MYNPNYVTKIHLILSKPPKKRPRHLSTSCQQAPRNSVTLLISPPFFEGPFDRTSAFIRSQHRALARSVGISRIGVRSWMLCDMTGAQSIKSMRNGAGPSGFGGPIIKGVGRHPSKTGQRTTPTTVSSIDLIGKQLPLLCAASERGSLQIADLDRRVARLRSNLCKSYVFEHGPRHDGSRDEFRNVHPRDPSLSTDCLRGILMSQCVTGWSKIYIHIPCIVYTYI